MQKSYFKTAQNYISFAIRRAISTDTTERQLQTALEN